MHHVGILARSILVLLVFSAGLAAVGWLGVNALQTYDRKVAELQTASERALYAARLHEGVIEAVMESRGIYMSKDSEGAKPFAKNLLDSLAEMEKLIPLYEKTQQPDRLQAFQERKKHLQDFITFRRETARLGTQVSPAAASEQGNNDANRANRRLVTEQLTEAAARNNSAIDSVVAELHAFGEREIPLLIGLSSAIALLTIAFGLAISILTITRPIAKLANGMNVLAKGDTGAEVYGAGRKDEIGQMAGSVQVFKDNMIAREKAEADIAEQRRATEEQRAAREIRERKAIEEISELCDKAAAGNLDTRLNEADKEGFLLTISQQLNSLTNTLQQMTRELADVTGAMAEGKLTRSVDGAYSGVYGQLKDSVNAMAGKLRDFAARLAETAQVVRNASAEISTASQDLAQRTESQAAAIEETAASMHEITTTVKQNADNAQAASQLAAVARDAADKGGAVMGNVVTAMSQIEGSAGKISDPVDAERLLQTGQADMIGMARQLLADPDWVKKVEQKRGDQIVRCIYCNVCKQLDENFKEVTCFLWPKGLVQAPADATDGAAPQWPEGGAKLVATVDKGQVKLSWAKAVAGAAPIAGYNVYRAEDDGAAHVTEAVKSTKHSDKVVLGGLRYTYYVRGHDAAGRATPPADAVRIEMPLPFAEPASSSSEVRHVPH